MNNKLKKYAPRFLGITTLLCVCCASILLFPKKDEAQIPTAEQSPALTRIPQATSTPQPIDPSASIPNILAADVTINLQNKFGMECTQIEMREPYNSRQCYKKELGTTFFVVVYGRGIFTVDYITATYTAENPSAEVYQGFLGYVATIPFVGEAQLQADARSWLVANAQKINAGAVETIIDGLRFTLTGGESALTLEIGELK